MIWINIKYIFIHSLKYINLKTNLKMDNNDIENIEPHINNKYEIQ